MRLYIAGCCKIIIIQNYYYTRAFRASYIRSISSRKLLLCRRKPRGEIVMEEFSRKCHDSFRCRRFPNSTEFPPRIVRLNPSEGIRDMGIRFPISSSVISGWTNQSSPSLFLFLSSIVLSPPPKPPSENALSN